VRRQVLLWLVPGTPARNEHVRLLGQDILHRGVVAAHYWQRVDHSGAVRSLQSSLVPLHPTGGHELIDGSDRQYHRHLVRTVDVQFGRLGVGDLVTTVGDGDPVDRFLVSIGSTGGRASCQFDDCEGEQGYELDAMPAEGTTAMIAVLKQRCVHESIPKIGSILPTHTGKRLSNDNVRISTARSGVVTECRLVRQSGINTTEHWESRGCRVGVQRFDILI